MSNSVFNNSYTELIEVEAVPVDISISLQGAKKQINYINPMNPIEIENYIALFTGSYGEKIGINKVNCVAVQVDGTNKVIKIVNRIKNGGMSTFTEAANIDIPKEGYVIAAINDSYTASEYMKFLAVNFNPGDVIKLRKNGAEVSIEDLDINYETSIELDNKHIYTVFDDTAIISGRLLYYNPVSRYILKINDVIATVSQDGSFVHEIKLSKKTNFIDVKLLNKTVEKSCKSVVIYRKEQTSSKKDIILWIDQCSNAKVYVTGDSIFKMLLKAKDAGVTVVMLDVKGYEGFVSYKVNNLTGAPYVSEMKSPSRAGANPDMDILQEFVACCKELGLKLSANLNIFGGGSKEESGILDGHPERVCWEEKLQHPKDKGDIKPVSQSLGKGDVVFLNPAVEGVQQYILDSIREILENYDVDGITLDRCRYDNMYAEFSEATRGKFAEYLISKGKQLEIWPDDAYKIDEIENKLDGKHNIDWYTFRSGLIKDFTTKVRTLVDEFKKKKNKSIELSVYVGSWYPLLYENGINWASPSFRYDNRLKFSENRIYTEDYYSTGYTDNFDYIMIGTYQKTLDDINYYITLGNILTNGEVPVLASMDVASLYNPHLQRAAFKAALTNSDGLMLFDLVTCNFDIIKASISDKEYAKEFQAGLSNPKDGSTFVEATYTDVNRNPQDIIIYTSDRGLKTGTSQFGVEITVGALGKVTETKNKKQAEEWVWTQVQQNNSNIPKGGFVISASDTSGSCVNRQLIAKSFDIGDDVRAAVLKWYYVMSADKNLLEFKGNVRVLGTGNAAVDINGTATQIAENGDFKASYDLIKGLNAVTITVYVDNRLTNIKIVEIKSND